MNGKQTILGLLVAAIATTALADVTRTPAAVVVTPNLRVASVRVERTGIAPDGSHQVRIDVQVVCNAAATTSVGPFALLLEYRDADGVYRRLGEASIARLTCGVGASVKVPTETRSFNAAVPRGTVRRFRATADPANVVRESNDTDNWYEVPYSAAGCPGVDLVLTHLQLDRSHTGSNVLVQATVRNRCLQDCVGDIYYVITPEGGASVEQRIAIRIDGETEVAHLGTTAVEVRAADPFTLAVRIETRGGCTDTTPGNNSCRVTLPAGTDARSFPCNIVPPLTHR